MNNNKVGYFSYGMTEVLQLHYDVIVTSQSIAVNNNKVGYFSYGMTEVLFI